jgi:hypothetical protein
MGIEQEYLYSVISMGRALFHTNILEIAVGAIEDIGGKSYVRYNEEAIVIYIVEKAA